MSEFVEEEAEQKGNQIEDRQREWGQQFDKWLIKLARQKKLVELTLCDEVPGITKDGKQVTVIPKRIDRYFIEVVVDRTEVWINKQMILGCKPVGSPSPLTDAEGEAPLLDSLQEDETESN